MTVATAPPLTTSSINCRPKYATRRRPERETFGPELAKVADMLGQPLMPWQRLVADVGCEINPLTGLPAYREVIVTVPRQSGKTTLFLSWQINRCVSRRWQHPQRSVFTAQTGKDARDKWLDELFPLIRNSRIKSLIASSGSRLEINQGMGNESIRFKTGSIIRLLSTSTTSGHSKTLHQAVMDEVWHDVDDRREQGLRPAMITMQDAQLLVCSTAGTDASTILNRKVEAGRAAVESDSGRGVAYFEYAAPDGWDPHDDDSFYEFHPALCPAPPCRCAPPGEKWRHTITIEAIQSERDAMDLPEFKRAYGNIKTSSGGDRAIPAALWDAVQDPMAEPRDGLAFGLDVHPDRTSAAIASSDGEAVEVIEHRPGTGWVEDRVKARLAELVASWGGEVVIDGGGPAVPVADDLEADGVPVRRMGGPEVAAACGRLYDAIADQEIRVRPTSQALDDAVAEVVKRKIGDKWVWDRTKSPVDITPLFAVTLAYGAREKPAGGLHEWPDEDELKQWGGLS